MCVRVRRNFSARRQQQHCFAFLVPSPVCRGCLALAAVCDTLQPSCSHSRGGWGTCGFCTFDARSDVFVALCVVCGKGPPSGEGGEAVRQCVALIVLLCVYAVCVCVSPSAQKQRGRRPSTHTHTYTQTHARTDAEEGNSSVAGVEVGETRRGRRGRGTNVVLFLCFPSWSPPCVRHTAGRKVNVRGRAERDTRGWVYWFRIIQPVAVVIAAAASQRRSIVQTGPSSRKSPRRRTTACGGR